MRRASVCGELAPRRTLTFRWPGPIVFSQVIPMICRQLRGLSSDHLSVSLAICIAVSGLSFMAVPTLLPSEDETPTITLRGPSLPWAAVAEGTRLRLEKQAQTNRVSLKKPARSAHQAAANTHQVRVQHLRPPQFSRDLPRRSLPAQRFTSRSSEDSGDPYLS